MFVVRHISLLSCYKSINIIYVKLKVQAYLWLALYQAQSENESVTPTQIYFNHQLQL